MKKTLVLGASPNPDRYSYRAVKSLQRREIPVIAVGRREGMIGDTAILKEIPGDIEGIHTVSMYMSAVNQEDFYETLLSLKPVRIIFNPGTSNPELAELAAKKGISVIENCMLDMLNSGKF
ncbi:MAG: CoA-binding protein [Bacteroidales bacterium]|nr:CoA-binding protein [Bacteroidales bacterium]MCU0407801.1 CoA-binding protein [Bacteroidales bacterium]